MRAIILMFAMSLALAPVVDASTPGRLRAQQLQLKPGQETGVEQVEGELYRIDPRSSLFGFVLEMRRNCNFPTTKTHRLRAQTRPSRRWLGRAGGFLRSTIATWLA